MNTFVTPQESSIREVNDRLNLLKNQTDLLSDTVLEDYSAELARQVTLNALINIGTILELINDNR